MDWSQYPHVFVAGVAAIGLLCLFVRNSPALHTPTDHPRKGELLALLGICVLGIVIVYGAFYMQRAYFSYVDVGSDTSEQYVPYYLNLLDSIRNGTLGFWNFEYGLGTSFMSYQSWTLDPFNLVIIPLGLLLGNGALGLILVFVQTLKVIICALLFDYVLSFYCRIPLSRILGASLVAFCGFLMLWGQHYWLGSVLVMAIALTAALESLMVRQTIPRIVLLTVLTAATILMSTYSGFMVMVYATIYAVLRVIHVADCHTVRDFFRAFVPLAVPVICGVLISLLTVIPYATLLLGESSRVAGGEASGSSTAGHLMEFIPFSWLLPILSRMLGNGLMSIGVDIPATLIPPTESFSYVNVYEFIQLGFSAGYFMLLGQFAHWAVRESPRRDRTLITIAAMLCILYCINSFLPALFNVFVDPKYRSSFVLAIPICIAIACAWEHRVATGTLSRSNLIVCFIITVGVIIWSLIHTVNGRLVCLSYLLLALVAFAALYASSSVHGTPRETIRQPHAIRWAAPCCLALACIVGSSVIDAFFITNSRTTSTENTFPYASENAIDADTRAALAWVREQEDGTQRTVKLYGEWTVRNDALIQHFYGISSYNSTLDSDIIDFYRHLWPGIFMGDVAYQDVTNDPDHPELMRLLGVTYILSRDDLSFAWCEHVTTCGSVHVYRVQGAHSMISVRTGAVAESDAEAMTPEGRESLLAASVIVPDEVAQSIAAAPAQDVGTTYTGATVESAQGEIITEPAVGTLEVTGRDSIAGTFRALADNSIMSLAIPHTTGWIVEIDGKVVDTYRANYGFIGYTVSAGEHTLTAHFEPPHALIGCVAAAVGVLSCTLYCVFIYRKRKL